MSGFDARTLSLLDQTTEVDIETRRRDGTARTTTIWIIVDTEDVYVRSVRGPQGGWYRALVRDGQARLHVDGQVLAVRATADTDPATVARVSDAIKRKYQQRWSGPTASMLQPDALATTLRLEPA